MKRILDIIYYNSISIVKRIKESIILNSVMVLVFAAMYWFSFKDKSAITDYAFFLLFFPVIVGIGSINRNIRINTLVGFPFSLPQIISVQSIKSVVYSLITGLIIIGVARMPFLLSIDILILNLYISMTAYFIIHFGIRKLYDPDLPLLFIISIVCIAVYALIRFLLMEYLIHIFIIDAAIILVYHTLGIKIISMLFRNRISEIVESNL